MGFLGKVWYFKNKMSTIHHLPTILLFLLGLCVGSFLNVFIDWSVGKRKSLFTPPSYCDHCEHRLGFWDLIPVFSFLFLRGRCRYCGKQILLQYPLVELATGLVFVAVAGIGNRELVSDSFAGFQFLIPYAYSLLVFLTLIVVFVTDLRYGVIPDRVILPAIFLSLPYSLFVMHNSLLTALVVAFAFFLLYFFSKGKALGFGDVKLVFFLSLTLGFPYVILALWISFVLGGLVAGILLFLGKKKLKDEIPLGPFLVIGTVLTMFFGKAVLFRISNFGFRIF